jgi:hypothetical protein
MTSPKPPREVPFKCFAWNDDITDESMWCDGHEAVAAYIAVCAERDALNQELAAVIGRCSHLQYDNERIKLFNEQVLKERNEFEDKLKLARECIAEVIRNSPDILAKKKV